MVTKGVFMRGTKPTIIMMSFIFALALTGCKDKGEKTAQDAQDTSAKEVNLVDVKILGLPPLPVPANNPQTPEKIALGKQLFNEKRFSGDGTVSCANCHDPSKAFVDRLPVSRGISNQTGTRNAPTVINAAYLDTQFWDGRRPTLEAQSKDPLLNPVEHGLKSHDEVLQVVRGDENYKNQFKTVFGISESEITIDHVAMAIASFERTIISGNSPFDRYNYGNDKSALAEEEVRGMAIYMGKGRCQECHTIGEQYATFTDNKFHNLGIGIVKYESDLQNIVSKYKEFKDSGEDIDHKLLSDREVSELGRYAITLEISDVGAFKTPTLRNIAKTAPYMHDGSLKTLEEVVEHYNKGGNKNPFLSGSIRELNLTANEKKDLTAFLKRALTSPEFDK